jgi:hypothetical protein
MYDILWQGYIVLNRPWAFVQWLQQVDIKEEYDMFNFEFHFLI